MKSKSIYHSFLFFFFSFFLRNNRQYQKQLNSIGKDANYDLITPNGIIRHFIVFIEAEAVSGITQSERVKIRVLFSSQHPISVHVPELPVIIMSLSFNKIHKLLEFLGNESSNLLVT